MQVILIGAGRYGNGLVGKKYTDGTFNTKLVAVVDPNIETISNNDDYCLGNLEQYKYFDDVPSSKIDDTTIAEVAVVPQIIPNLFKLLVNAGVKNVILPKPVTSDSASYGDILDLAKKNDIKVAITSNWYYSDITKLTKALLDKATGRVNDDKQTSKKYSRQISTIPTGFSIDKVEIEYNKKHEKLEIDPPSQELPHALQIMKAIGLTNYKDMCYVLPFSKQTKSAVSVKLIGDDRVKNGIYINSDLQKTDLPVNRERLLKIYLDDDDVEPDIITDYDALFDSNGNCLKNPKVSVDITKHGRRIKWQKTIKEDNLNVMYDKIMNYFEGNTDDVLTLEKYKPVSDAICIIQKAWENIVKDY